MKVLVSGFVLILSVTTLLAQEVPVVHGHFHSDSVSIGQAVPYSLTAKYPRANQVLFPDSTFRLNRTINSS